MDGEGWNDISSNLEKQNFKIYGCHASRVTGGPSYGSDVWSELLLGHVI